MNRGFKPHKIMGIIPDSIAQELEIKEGDQLLALNNEKIQDVFDYRYLLAEEELDILIRTEDGEEILFEIEKDYGEDLGLIFESDLMDDLIRCKNKCQFCFIDQLPPNMRETVYFKDDDWRMSFLNGNYITLTNMSDEDINRLIKYRLSPINISIHATDPEIRQSLIKNKNAGKILEQLKLLTDNGIEVNGQIVLCKGLNDGEVLDQTIRDLSAFIPNILSLTVVPVGLSKYRSKLTDLKGFDKESSKQVIEVIKKWQHYYLEKMDTRFVFAADEFYVVGEEERPSYEEYENFPVLDNGVGMLTKFYKELEESVKTHAGSDMPFEASIATGCITETFINECVTLIKTKFPNVTLHVYPIQNNFFGEEVTVTGLITGQDLVGHLKEEALGKVLLLAENMLKCGEEVFLDDYTVQQLSKELNIPIQIMPNDGTQWLETMIYAKEKYNE